MDVTATEIPYTNNELSLILLLPGKQTEFVAGGLKHLEDKLNVRNWNSLMKCFVPLNIDLQLPVFSHRSQLELKQTLLGLGIVNAFKKANANFRGINGVSDLYLSSFAQISEFVLDHGELENKEQNKQRSAKILMDILSNRQARQNENVYRMQFNRQFLYLVRHNPSGAILHIGRYYQPAEAHSHHHGDHIGHHEHGHGHHDGTHSREHEK